MEKKTLILEIQAYADASRSNNSLLVERSAVALKSLLDKLPEEIAEVSEDKRKTK